MTEIIYQVVGDEVIVRVYQKPQLVKYRVFQFIQRIRWFWSCFYHSLGFFFSKFKMVVWKGWLTLAVLIEFIDNKLHFVTDTVPHFYEQFERNYRFVSRFLNCVKLVQSSSISIEILFFWLSLLDIPFSIYFPGMCNVDSFEKLRNINRKLLLEYFGSKM